MWFEPYKMEDGYVEQLVSLEKKSTPIFRLRAVLSSNSKYGIVIRDFMNGHIMESSLFKYDSWFECLVDGQKLCLEFVKPYCEKCEGRIMVIPPILPTS